MTDLRMPNDERAGLRVVDAARRAGVPVAVLTGAAGDLTEELAALEVPLVVKDDHMSEHLAMLVARAFEA